VYWAAVGHLDAQGGGLEDLPHCKFTRAGPQDYQREGGSLEERLEQTRRRDANDSARYKRLYDIDNSDKSFADMVIDTAALEAEEVARLIIKEARAREAR
jgi:cytidylate kinase